VVRQFRFSRHIFIKFSDINFHETSSCRSRADACGETEGRADGHGEANRQHFATNENALRKMIAFSLLLTIYEVLQTDHLQDSITIVKSRCILWIVTVTIIIFCLFQNKRNFHSKIIHYFYLHKCNNLRVV